MGSSALSSAENRMLIRSVRPVVEAAARVIRRNYGKIKKSSVQEKAKHDFVTNVDRKSQDILIKGLAKAFPGYGVLAEEDEYSIDGERRWVIDPVDGTANFIQEIPAVSISIGLMEEDEVIFGVVYDPIHDEWFHAAKGCGSKLNRKSIAVSGADSIADAILATGFPFRNKKRFKAYNKSFCMMFDAAGGMRRLGSAALDLCYTACGRYDGFWEIGLQPWDSSAGSLIVQEAGGIVSDFEGGGFFLQSGDTLAASPVIYRHMLRILRKVPELRNNVSK